MPDNDANDTAATFRHTLNSSGKKKYAAIKRRQTTKKYAVLFSLPVRKTNNFPIHVLTSVQSSTFYHTLNSFSFIFSSFLSTICLCCSSVLTSSFIYAAVKFRQTLYYFVSVFSSSLTLLRIIWFLIISILLSQYNFSLLHFTDFLSSHTISCIWIISFSIRSFLYFFPLSLLRLFFHLLNIRTSDFLFTFSVLFSASQSFRAL